VVSPALSAPELLAAVPGLSDVPAELRVQDFRNKPGASLDFPDLYELADALNEALNDGRVGAVVTQGTDTIEEAAYALDLLVPTEAPVVVTGAMRNPAMAGADGPANLLAAIMVAASPCARGLGCLVVLNDEVHAARWVRKVHTGSPAAFVSPDHGPLGHVAEGRVHIPVRVGRQSPVLGCGTRRSARVGLVTIALGDDGTLVEAMAGQVHGLVVAGFGAGHVPAAVAPVLGELASHIPVVLASRTGAGPVHRVTYGFAGSERDLLARGLISAGCLDPLKARILLHLLIASGTGVAGIREAFEAAGDGSELDVGKESGPAEG
jgi:L-asparaginase